MVNTIKKVLCLGAGFDQYSLIKILKKKNFYVIALDNNKNSYSKDIADEFYSFNLKNHKKLLNFCKKINVVAVMTHAAELSIQESLIANYLKLRGNSLSISQTLTLKDKRALFFKKNEINYPDFQIVNNLKLEINIIKNFLKKNKSIVIKPTNLSGAKGVEKIENIQQLKNYINHSNKKARYIIEKKINGLEISSESIVQNHKIVHTSFALRHYDKKFGRFFIEDGHSFPYSLSPSLLAIYKTEIKRIMKLLKFNEGVLKGDLIINNGKIYFLELANRTSGGGFCDKVVPLSNGINILELLVDIKLGKKIKLSQVTPKWSFGISQRFIFPTKNVHMIEYMDTNNPNLLSINLFKDKIDNFNVDNIKSHADRIGYVIFKGKNRKEADKYANKYLKRELKHVI